MSGCFFKGDDSFVLRGHLISTIPQVNLVGSPKPVIEVFGGSSEAFTVTFTDDDFGSTRVAVLLKGLSANQTYIFEISQNGILDPVLTFPYAMNGLQDIDLPALPLGTMEAIYALAQTEGVNQDKVSKGVVMGQVSSNGTGCSPLVSVSIQSAQTSIGAIDGPFYFDTNGNLTQSQFSDAECNYIFFNVPTGNFTLSFASQFSSVDSDIAVTAFAGKVSFGLNLP
ncbi:MAG: hypothetical protein KDD48_02355 [Bdellovibrionales bacterium]|nr:hypothetical protein [Bdellovibrionales bacterium]